jgi:capsular exopolysaccharide synthesis family protein
VNGLLNETYEKDELYEKVKIEYKLDSQILTILVEERSPEKAMALANTMAKTFKDETKLIMNLKNVTILSKATLVEDTNAPIPVLFFSISAVIGFLLSYILLFAQEIFSTIIDSPQKAEKVLGLPIIGVLPFGEISHNEVLADRFNFIRNNLLNMLSKQNSKTLLITSAESGDGKSFISTNLSIAFATDLKKTVYVNANLRDETGPNLFQLPNHLGVTSYVTGLSKLQDIIQDTEVPNLSFISAGPISSNPPVLLSSTKFSQLMNDLKNLFDIIIIDSPPLNIVDTLLISTHVDTCLYVVNAESSKIEQSIYSIERLKKVHAPLIRLILNKTNT